MTDTAPASNHIVLSGCSGGGKSTLLAELARRGFATVPEPGRRIVAEERAGEGRALPWVDPIAFAHRALALAAEDRQNAAQNPGWTIFDRGLVDAAVALEHLTSKPTATLLAPHARYHPKVFLTPPWPEIYVTDAERRHGFDEAVAEYERLVIAYGALGYEVVVLPKVRVEERAEVVMGGVG